MTDVIGKAFIEVAADGRRFASTASDEIRPGYAAIDRDTNSLGSRIGSRLGSVFKTVGIGASVAIGAALVGVFKTGLGELQDYEAGRAQLEAGLKSTGNTAGITVNQMESLASSIQNYSGQTDDSIVKTESLLLTFKNIKNQAGQNNDIFTQTTKIAADMAARMGGDASGAAIQLGKALNDPIAGISALSRVGVTFTEGQKKQIAAMVDAGNTMGAQKIILKELNSEFGGSAEAAGKTLPGQLAILKRHFEDVSQTVVTALVPALTSSIHFISDEVAPAISSLASTLITRAQPAFQAVGSYIRDDVIPVLQGIASFVVDTLVPAIAQVLGGALDGLRSAFQTISGAIQSHRAQLTTLFNAFKEIAGFIVEHVAPILGKDLKLQFEILGHAVSIVIDVISGIVTVFQSVIGAGKKVGDFFTGPFLRAIGDMTSTFLKGIGFILDNFLNMAGAILHGAVSMMGWVPGIGPKLHRAADAFDAFRAGVADSLDRARSEADSWGEHFKEVGFKAAHNISLGFGSFDLAGAVYDSVNAAFRAADKGARDATESKSPSQVFYRVGSDIMAGLQNGIIDNTAKTLRAIQDVGTAIVQRVIDGIAAKRDALKSALDSVRQEAASFASGIASSITSGAGISNAPDSSAGSVEQFLLQEARKAKRLQHLTNKLLKEGYSADVVSQIAGMGDAGIDYAKNLAAEPYLHREINQAERQINKAAQATGESISDKVFGPKLDRIAEHLQGVKQDVSKLHDLLNETKDMNGNISHLGDKIGHIVSDGDKEVFRAARAADKKDLETLEHDLRRQGAST